MAALALIANMKAHSTRINIIAREMALDIAHGTYTPNTAAHIAVVAIISLRKVTSRRPDLSYLPYQYPILCLHAQVDRPWLFPRMLAVLKSIFNAYAASALVGDADSMDMDELRDFVVDTNLEVEGYGWQTMQKQYKEANVGSSDEVLELHEFLVCLVRISFYRANPRYGMRVGASSKQGNTGSNLALTEGHAALKGQGRRGASKGRSGDADADATAIDAPLPGCLFDMLNSCVLPLARRDGDQQLFVEEILPSEEVQLAIAECQKELSRWYELTSEGRDYLTLEQWLTALDRMQLLTDVTIQGHRIRLTEPQARSAFFAAAAAAHVHQGLLPSELAACVVRTACDKYKSVDTLSNGMRFTSGDKLRAFLANLFGTMDEEEVLADVTPAAGGAEGAEGAAPRKTLPPRAPQSPRVGASPRNVAASPRDAAASPRLAVSPRHAAPPSSQARPAVPAAIDASSAASPPMSGGDLGPRTAAAVLASLLPDDFINSLLPEMGVGGEGSEEMVAIASVIEEMGAAQPLLLQGLQQQQGVLLFSALDRQGDGMVSKAALAEGLHEAVASQTPLLKFFVEAAREKDGEYIALS